MSTPQRFDGAILARLCCVLPLPELLRLRVCSKSLLALCSEELTTTMVVLVRKFIPEAESFLDALVHHNAVLCGAVALLFMLRDDSFIPDTLDISVPHEEFVSFVDLLERQHHARLSSFGVEGDNRGTAGIARLRVGSAQLAVICSTGKDQLAPVAGHFATHLVVYVSPSHFGAAYPSLLFARRALLGHGGSAEQRLACVKECRLAGIDIRLDVFRWPEYQEGMACGGEKWACVSQPWHFEDAGALAAHIHPLASDTIKTWVVWRLDNRPCGGSCYHDANGILSDGDLHMTLVTVDEEYAATRY